MSVSKCQWGCCDYNTDKAEYVEGTFSESTNEDEDTVFVCDECGDEFSDTDDAEACCAHWSCNYCGDWSSSQHDATYCCHQSCYDCGEEGWPNDLEDHECESDDDDGCSCCGSSSMGHSSNPPWVVRGDLEYQDPRAAAARSPKGKWQTVWGFEPMHHDPVKAAGEYYILDSIMSGIIGKSHPEFEKRRWYSDETTRKVLRMEAEALMESMLAEFVPVFRAYAHLAIGGELRHHVAVGGHVLPTTRSKAWAGWKSIYEAVGPQALLDAAELFEEFGGGTYGGKPWADACRVLHAFETKKLSAQVFLDRMFALQHNGGCFLNKVTWADKNDMGWGVHDLQFKLLPAHGAEPEPDYGTLLGVCGQEVRSLFADWWRLACVPGQKPAPKQPNLNQWMPYVPQPLRAQWTNAVKHAMYYEKVAKQYAADTDPYSKSYAKDYFKAASDYWFEACKLKVEFLVNGDPASMTHRQMVKVALAKKARAFAKKEAALANCQCWMHGGAFMSNEDGWFNPNQPSTYEDNEGDFDF